MVRLALERRLLLVRLRLHQRAMAKVYVRHILVPCFLLVLMRSPRHPSFLYAEGCRLLVKMGWRS